MSRQKLRILIILCLIAAILAGLMVLLVNGYRKYQYAAYPLAYASLIEQYSEQYDVTPSLICAVICTESHFQPDVISHAGAIGLMQLTPETFAWAQMRAGVKDAMGAETLTDPETNIQYGTFTLKLMHEMFEDPVTALAAYNAGQGNVQNWLNEPQYSADGVHLDTIPFEETAEYVKRVKKAQTIYRQLYSLD